MGDTHRAHCLSDLCLGTRGFSEAFARRVASFGERPKPPRSKMKWVGIDHFLSIPAPTHSSSDRPPSIRIQAVAKEFRLVVAKSYDLDPLATAIPRT